MIKLNHHYKSVASVGFGLFEPTSKPAHNPIHRVSIKCCVGVMMMGPRGFHAMLTPAPPNTPPPCRLVERNDEEDGSPAKRRRSWWDKLAQLDVQLGSVESQVLPGQVGTLVVTVDQSAYDFVSDTTDLEDRALVRDVFHVLPGIYHKLGSIPMPPEEFGLVITEPMPLYRQMCDANNAPGLFLYTVPGKGWFFSGMLNISNSLSYEDAGVVAWSPDTDLNDNQWPSDSIHVPYYAAEHFGKVSDIATAITVEPYTTWANRQIVSMSGKLEQIEDDEAHAAEVAAQRPQPPPVQAKHGGFQEKTARLIALYRKGNYAEFEAYVDELDNGGNFSRVLAKHMRA